MRFLNTVAAVALGLAAAAHGRAPMINREVSQPASTSASAAAPTPTFVSQLPGGVFVTATPAESTAPADVTSSINHGSSVETSVPAASSATDLPRPQPTTGSGNSGHISPSSPYKFSNGTAPATSLTAAGSRCSKDGQWNCLSDGKSYQRCSAGLWSVAMPVALGTLCKPGLADTFVLAQKRSSSGFVRRRRFVYEHSRGKRGSSRMD